MVDRDYSGFPCRGVAFNKSVPSIAYIVVEVNWKIFRNAPTRSISSPVGAAGESPLVDPNESAKSTVRPRDEDAVLQNGAVSPEYSDRSELAGAQGRARQRSAVQKVLLLNWRGIVHTTLTMILTNYVLIVALSLN